MGPRQPVRLWKAIQEAAKKSAPFLIYSDNDAVVRALRDNLRDDIGEVLIDDEETHRKPPSSSNEWLRNTEEHQAVSRNRSSVQSLPD